MTALVIAAKAAIEQVTAGEDHQSVLEVEIEALDKCLSLLGDGG